MIDAAGTKTTSQNLRAALVCGPAEAARRLGPSAATLYISRPG